MHLYIGSVVCSGKVVMRFTVAFGAETSSTVNIKGVKGSEYFRINRSILLVTAWSSLWFIDPYFRPCEVKPSPIHRLSLRIIISSWEQTFIKNYRTILIKTTLDKSSLLHKVCILMPKWLYRS